MAAQLLALPSTVDRAPRNGQQIAMGEVETVFDAYVSDPLQLDLQPSVYQAWLQGISVNELFDQCKETLLSYFTQQQNNDLLQSTSTPPPPLPPPPPSPPPPAPAIQSDPIHSGPIPLP